MFVDEILSRKAKSKLVSSKTSFKLRWASMISVANVTKWWITSANLYVIHEIIYFDTAAGRNYLVWKKCDIARNFRRVKSDAQEFGINFFCTPATQAFASSRSFYLTTLLTLEKGICILDMTWRIRRYFGELCVEGVVGTAGQSAWKRTLRFFEQRGGERVARGSPLRGGWRTGRACSCPGKDCAVQREIRHNTFLQPGHEHTAQRRQDYVVSAENIVFGEFAWRFGQT